MLAIISGDCSAALTAALSFSTTSTGVPPGAHIPAQNSSVSSSRPSSFMGGAETELAGIGLGVGDEFVHRIGRHLCVDGEHGRGARNEGDGRKILLRIVFD